MAPHALIDLHDATGYTPSDYHMETLLVPAKRNSKSKAQPPVVSTLSSDLHFDISVDGKSCTPQARYFWRLSSEEISEIESSVRHFQRTGHAP